MNVENLQEICKTLKSVTEDIKWGHDLVFSVGGKMFLVAGLDENPVNASFKVTDTEFEELITRNGFKPAPYLARYKWVWVDDINRISRKEWLQRVSTAYTLVREKLPPKIRKELDK